MMFNAHSYQQFCFEQVVNKPALGLFLDMG